jgi:hypothetical protein
LIRQPFRGKGGKNMKRAVLAAVAVLFVVLVAGASRAPAGQLSNYDGASW